MIGWSGSRRTQTSDKRPHGQSFVEFALFLPVLLIMLAGLIEIGAYANAHMTFLDASREGARFGANLDPVLTAHHPFDMREGADPFPDVRAMSAEQLREICGAGGTTNFYYEVACVVFQNIPLGQFDPNPRPDGWPGDDIVITVIGVQNGVIVSRLPRYFMADPRDPQYHYRGANDAASNPTCVALEEPVGDIRTQNCRSWSLYGNHETRFDNALLLSRLRHTAPATGYVIVEVFHAQPHFTSLFTIGDFIPDPIHSWVFTVFPVAAAEPR